MGTPLELLMSINMKRFKVSWEHPNEVHNTRETYAISDMYALAYVERELKGTALRGNSTMLPDGFITMFEVEEINS